jgi:membrane-associated phospholipid phosphatase
MIRLIEHSTNIGQFLIPVSSGLYALYKGDYIEARRLLIAAAAQKIQLVFLKHLFPRVRPNGLDHKSFPSSHTAGAFLGVGLSLAKYGLMAPSTLIGLIGAIWVGCSRFFTNHHWPSDVLAGAVIGLINGAIAGITNKGGSF